MRSVNGGHAQAFNRRRHYSTLSRIARAGES
jgi:hypothetical protein